MGETGGANFDDRTQATVIELHGSVHEEQVNVAENQGQADADNHQLDDLEAPAAQRLPQNLVLDKPAGCTNQNRHQQHSDEGQPKQAAGYPCDNSPQGDCLTVGKV